MNLHNKFEISYQNKQYIARNKMFERVLDAIGLYKGYAVALSLGNGEVNLATNSLGSLQEEKMTESIGIFKPQEVEYQLNPLKGALFARHKLTIPAGTLPAGTEISEVGFCVSQSTTTLSDNSPVITLENTTPLLYNYAYFSSISGEPQKIVVAEDEPLVFYATIFMDWDNSAGIMPTGGDNKFLKFLLGSNVYNGTAPVFDFGGGQDHRPNEIQVEQDYLPSKRYLATNTTPIITKNNNAIEFLFYKYIPEAPIYTYEVVLYADGIKVIRQNRQHMLGDNYYKETLTVAPSGTLSSRRHFVGKIHKLENITTGEIIEGEDLKRYDVTRLGCNFSEAYPKPFGADRDYNISETGNWRVFQSKCGNMLAFVSSDTVDIYKHQNDSILKLDSSAIENPQTITELQFFYDHVFVVRNTAPYVDYYKWENGKLEKMFMNFASFVTASFSNVNDAVAFTNASTQQISFGSDSTGCLVCAIVLNSTKTRIIRLKTINRSVVLESTAVSPLYNTTFVGATLFHGEVEGEVLLCGKDNNSTTFLYTYDYNQGFAVVESSILTNEFNTEVLNYIVGKNFVFVNRSVTPRNVMIYFPSCRRYNLADAPQFVNYIGKNGILHCRLNTSNNNLQSVYTADDNNLYVSSNSPELELYNGCMVLVQNFDNGLILFRDEPPYTVYFNLGNYEYAVLNGFSNVGEKYYMYVTQNMPYINFFHKNMMLSIVVSLQSDPVEETQLMHVVLKDPTIFLGEEEVAANVNGQQNNLDSDQTESLESGGGNAENGDTGL